MTTLRGSRLTSPAIACLVAVVLLLAAMTVADRQGDGDRRIPAEVLGERIDATGSGAVTGSPSGGNGQDKAKKAFPMTGTVLGPLYPGARRTLRVTATNPNSQDVQVLTVTATAEDPEAAGCDAGWVVVDGYTYAGGAPVIVTGKGGTATLDLTVGMVNLPDVNQDACKGTTFHLSLSGSARSTS